MIHIAASLPGQYFNKGKELLFQKLYTPIFEKKNDIIKSYTRHFKGSPLRPVPSPALQTML